MNTFSVGKNSITRVHGLPPELRVFYVLRSMLRELVPEQLLLRRCGWRERFPISQTGRSLLRNESRCYEVPQSRALPIHNSCQAPGAQPFQLAREQCGMERPCARDMW